MGTLEKICAKLSVPMPKPRIRLPREIQTGASLKCPSVTPAVAAAALAALAGKPCGGSKALAWAKGKKILPPEVGAELTWPEMCHMLYRFARATRVNIPLPGKGRVFGLGQLPAWSLPGVQWCLSAGLLPEDISGPVTGTQLAGVLEHYRAQLADARKMPEVSVKIQLFGDSITDNTWGDRATWVNFFPHRLGNAGVELVNNAYGGGVLTAIPGKNNSVVKLLPRMLHPDTDWVIVFALTNDYAAPAFGVGEPDSTEEQTVPGAIATLSQAVGTRPLLVITSPHRCNYLDKTLPVNDLGERVNARGWTLAQGARAALSAAQRHNADTLDLYGEPVFSGEEVALATIDGLHPNELGDILIAARIFQKLTQLLGEGWPQRYSPPQGGAELEVTL